MYVILMFLLFVFSLTFVLVYKETKTSRIYTAFSYAFVSLPTVMFLLLISLLFVPVDQLKVAENTLHKTTIDTNETLTYYSVVSFNNQEYYQVDVSDDNKREHQLLPKADTQLNYTHTSDKNATVVRSEPHYRYAFVRYLLDANYYGEARPQYVINVPKS